MNLYTSATSIESHRTRIVLNEKDIVHEVNIVDPKKLLVAAALTGDSITGDCLPNLSANIKPT